MQRPQQWPVVGQQAQAFGNARIYQALRDQYIEHHEHYEHGVRRADPAARDAVCPYPTGLAAFRQQEAEWFFGRDRLIAALVERLDHRLNNGGGPLVVVAPSGAGKSSLLQAGLIPRLRQGALPGSQRWRGLLLTPTAYPVMALATQIAALTNTPADQVAGQITWQPEQCVQGVRAQLTRTDPATARLMVIVDQLEELFTMCPDTRQRHLFLNLISRLTSRGPGGQEPAALAVYGLRADFYAQCADHPQLLAAVQDGQLLVGPMSPEALRSAILNPAQRAGLRIEPGLVDLLLRDLGATAAEGTGDAAGGYEAGRLPLLAHALRATWRERHGHTMTVDSYRNTGGILHAVANTAESAFTSLRPVEQHIARMLFLRLVKIGEGTEDTRRQVARADLLGDGSDQWILAVLQAFTAARLLTQGQETVQITHEALLRAWPRLREWINEDRAGNLIRQRLIEAATAWQLSGRDPAGLYRGSLLQAAREQTTSQRDSGLGPVVEEFLGSSIGHARRAANRRRGVLAALAMLTVFSLISAVVAVWQQNTANTQRDNAFFNQLTAQADRLQGSAAAGTDTSLAAQLNLAAYRLRPNDRTLYTNLINTENTPLATRLTDGITGAVSGVVFSPDGHTLAAGTLNGTVRLWNVVDPENPAPLGQPLTIGSRVDSLAYSPDGRTLAVGALDGTVRLWDVTDPKNPTPLGQPLRGGTGIVYPVVFSPDGDILAAGYDSGTVWLWNVAAPANPTPLGQPLAIGGPVYTAVFSPDGRTLAVNAGSAVRLWNVIDPANPTPLGQPLNIGNVVAPVVFSPDGHALAAGNGAGVVRLWNVADPANPTLLGQPLNVGSPVDDVAFSPNDRTLAAGSVDGAVHLWNVADVSNPTSFGPPLTGPTSGVASVVFSPDSRTIAVGSLDHTVRLWHRPDTLLTSPSTIDSVTFSPNGRILAAGGGDGAVRLLDVRDPEHPASLGQPLAAGTATVGSLVFSPDGRTLAAGNLDGTVRLWDVTDPATPISLGPPIHVGSTAYSVAYSPDGRTLAVGSGGTVHLWDVSDPAAPASLGQPLSGGTDLISSLAFRPDGHTLASSDADGTVRLWNVTDPADPTLLGQPLDVSSPANSVAFSPDGRTLAVSNADGTVRLWNATDPAAPTSAGPPISGGTSAIYSAVFSPDGHLLATSNADGTVRLWNITEPANPVPVGQSIAGGTGIVSSVAFSPDGRTLANGSLDRTLKLWALNVGPAIQRICATTRNVLTPETWLTDVPGLPFTPPCESA